MLKNPRLFLLPCNFVCNIAPYLRCQGDIITQSPGIIYHTLRVIIQPRSLSFNIWVMMIRFMSTGPSAICRSERFESHWDTSFLCVTRKDVRWSSEGDVVENYVRGMTAVKKWKNAMRWMQSNMVLFQRIPGAALEERWTQTGMSSITSVCCRKLRVTGWRILRCLRGVSEK